MLQTSESHPLKIDFVDFKWTENGNKLGIFQAPGRNQTLQTGECWKRNLYQDLDRMKNEYKIDTIVSMLEKYQAENRCIGNQLEEAEKRGIKAYNFPVHDYGYPQNQGEFKQFVKEVVDKNLYIGKNVMVHCNAGMGRAPIFAASCLMYAGVPNQDAIQMVKKARVGCLASQFQLNFLKRLKFP